MLTMTHRLNPVLNPSSIAIVGASGDANRIGGIALDHLTRLGFSGAVYPINPKYTELAGHRCYPSVEALPVAPDLAVLVLGADEVLPALESCHARGIRSAIVYASGFAEAGPAGVLKQQALARFARRTGMLVVGPNCMGLANLMTRAITTFAPTFRFFPPDEQVHADVSLLTQSGLMCTDAYVMGWLMNMRFRHFINTGNEACLEYAEFLDYLAHDEGTVVVGGYIEGLRDGARFMEVALRMHQAGQSLVVLKSGESERGAEVTQAHTAAVAGHSGVCRAALAQLGVLQARHTVHWVDLVYLSRFVQYHAGASGVDAASGRRTLGPRVVVASISGAMGAVLSDLLSVQGLHLPQLSQHCQAQLRECIQGISMVSNPVDMTGQLLNRTRLVTQVLQAILQEDRADIVLVYLSGTVYERIAPELMEIAATTRTLLVVVSTFGQASTKRFLEEAGIPVFPDAARASEALGSAVRCAQGAESTRHWAELRQQIRTRPVVLPHPPEVTEGDAVKQWLMRCGVEGMGRVVSVQESAREETSSSEYPLTVRITRDPVWGSVMSVAWAGAMADVLNDVSYRLLPVDTAMARAMLQELRAYPWLQGGSERTGADLEATISTLAALSNAALSLGESLQVLEINPLRVKPEGQGVEVVQALLHQTARKVSL